MESARERSNLGPDPEDIVKTEEATKHRQPKKRFVGRRAALAEKAEQEATNGTIENSAAIQGMSGQGKRHPNVCR